MKVDVFICRLSSAVRKIGHRNEYECDDEKRSALFYGIVAKGPVPKHDLAVAPEFHVEKAHNDTHSGGFYPSRDGAGRASSEHKRDHHEERAFPKGANMYRIIPGGAACDRLKKGIEQLVFQGKPGKTVLPFENEKSCHAAENQYQRDDDGEF